MALLASVQQSRKPGRASACSRRHSGALAEACRDSAADNSGDKLEAVGYGVFVPFFFVSTGVRFDLDALFASAETIARVPIFLAALLVARGLPALVYRPLGTRTQTAAAALLQATSLSSWWSRARWACSWI
jgi:Kef-type K+ transport system membrane component KefB